MTPLAHRSTDPCDDWNAERVARLRLARAGGCGPVLYARFVARFKGALQALDALPRLIELGRVPPLRVPDAGKVLAEVEAAARIGARLLEQDDPLYPQALRDLYDPPAFLAVLGRPEALARPAVAVVGARNASMNGRLFAEETAEAAASRGILVVSGLARGIDTAAHRGALRGAGGTAAVLACGVDVAYPPENEPLLRAVAEAGCAVSERPLGAAPLAKHFPKRNRLIAALAQGTLVVEAAERSGSLMTARLAADLGREVMAVPGSPKDPRHAGTNRLLREGAALVAGIDDLLAGLNPPLPSPRPVRAAPPPFEPIQAPAAPPPPPDPSGVLLAARILAGLGAAPVAVDEVIRQCQGSPPDVQDALVDLELEGHILRHPGNRVSRRGA
ncbi:MAG: DNA-processing protein DprA [Geminicoccaceae bacterium]|nr:DNA-processing protein DprA [Geminicoccaceae bacterium]